MFTQLNRLVGIPGIKKHVDKRKETAFGPPGKIGRQIYRNAVNGPSQVPHVTFQR